MTHAITTHILCEKQSPHRWLLSSVLSLIITIIYGIPIIVLIYLILPLVLGPESPDKLGVVLPHEHLLLDFRKAKIRPQYLPQDAIRDLSLEMNNLGKIRQYL